MTAEEVVTALADGTLGKIAANDVANIRPSLLALVRAVVDDNGIPRARVRDEVVVRLRAALGLT